jgi:hypothetical protein
MQTSGGEKAARVFFARSLARQWRNGVDGFIGANTG